MCNVGPARWGCNRELGFMALFRKHTRSRIGESRRKAKLFYQQIFEEMDRERQQLKEHCQAHAIPEDEEDATLH